MPLGIINTYPMWAMETNNTKLYPQMKDIARIDSRHAANIFLIITLCGKPLPENSVSL
jgi:hypothetical protein